MAGRACWNWRLAQFRLIDAPSRASAARNSSSSTEDRVSATFATDFGSGAREAAGAVPARQRRLSQRQPSHRAPAEEAVDPLQDDIGGVLDFERHRALDPQHQRGRFLRLPLDRPRPLDFQGLGMGGDFGPGDFPPARDQLARGESLLGIGVGKHVAEQDGKRLGADRTGFGLIASVSRTRVREPIRVPRIGRLLSEAMPQLSSERKLSSLDRDAAARPGAAA